MTKIFSGPTWAWKAMWCPLTASKQPFQYHLPLCTVKVQTDCRTACTQHMYFTGSWVHACCPNGIPPQRPHRQSAWRLVSPEVLLCSDSASCDQVQAEHSSISSVFTKPLQVWDSKAGVALSLPHILQCLSVHTELEWHAPHGTVSMPSPLLRFTA